nr:MAG TPA: hypothetical protein [Caudoviricetes sp.]
MAWTPAGRRCWTSCGGCGRPVGRATPCWTCTTTGTGRCRTWGSRFRRR